MRNRFGYGLLGDFKNPRVKVQGYWATVDSYEPIDAILGKTEGNCIYCWHPLSFDKNTKRGGRYYSNRFTVDHFIPRILGGGDELKNLVPACYKCNSMKGGLHPSEWLHPETYAQLCKELGVTP